MDKEIGVEEVKKAVGVFRKLGLKLCLICRTNLTLDHLGMSGGVAKVSGCQEISSSGLRSCTILTYREYEDGKLFEK